MELNTLCIKRPHTRCLYLLSGNVQNCVDALDNCIKFLPQVDKSDMFIGGDYNTNFQKTRQENTKNLKHFATQHQLIQLIKETTRPLQSDAVIDLIFSNCQHIDSSGSLS